MDDYIQSRAKRVETLYSLKRIFRSQTSLFSFTPPLHFNVVVAAKSIGQSNMLNIEKGESIGFNAISLKTREKHRLWRIFDECLNHFAWDCSLIFKFFLSVFQ